MAPARPLFSMPALRVAVLLALLLAPLLALQGWAQTPPEPSAVRVRPPSELECPRNQLTLYGGRVQRYHRGRGQTSITIHTDWDTTETVTLRHTGRPDASRWFLLQGEAFKPGDWPRIESSPGRLRAGMRAAAWVCDDGRNATIDWQPPRAP